MNRRVLLLTTSICLGIVIACVLAASTYYGRITVPVRSTQGAIEAQNAATAAAFSLSATNAAAQTQLAMPTITPPPTSTALPTSTLAPTIPPPLASCEAEVQGTARALYPVPGQGHAMFYQLIEVGTRIKIVGRIADIGWYKVEVNGKQGWMKSEALKVLDSCKPTVFDLHYLADWLGPDEKLILDDTFASNANTWIDANTQQKILVDTSPLGESVLKISSEHETIVTTTNPRASDIPAFKLHSSFTVDNVIDKSYFGIRFRDSGAEYFQFALFPSSCKIEVYATNDLVYPKTMDLKTCIDRYYDVYIVMSSDYKLSVEINGLETISINLQDPDGRYSHGKVDLVVNQVDANIDYIVITSPE